MFCLKTQCFNQWPNATNHFWIVSQKMSFWLQFTFGNNETYLSRKLPLKTCKLATCTLVYVTAHNLLTI